MLVSPSAVQNATSAAAMAAPRTPPAAKTTADSVLASLISDRMWTEALERIRSHPSEASQVIGRPFGDVLPLHEACKLQAPTDVVEALIEAFGPAVRTAGCQSVSLPVHFAVQTGSTEALVPLLRAYPAGTRKKDDRGRLPIHLGCEWEAPAAAIKALLMLYPESIYVRDADGKSPMDYAMKSKMGGDVGETVAVLKSGPDYCAVSKSAYTRLKEEFDVLMKNQNNAHETQVAELKKSHSIEVKLHRQLEEGYRSGLKSMGEQSNKFRKESQSLKKEKASMQEQIKILQNAEEVLHAHADALEKRLQEKISELQESRNVGESQKAQIQDLGLRLDSTETQLRETSSQLEITEKELRGEKEQVENLTNENFGQATKIEELTGTVSSLETKLEESRDEAREKGSSLQEATQCIETLKTDISNREARISELSEKVANLEAQLKDRCAEIETKDATIESTHEHIEVLSFNLESMTTLSNEQAKQISNLSSHNELLEMRLKEKSAAFEETSAALAESKERMEVLLRNLDSILRHNMGQAERIEQLNKTVISLSASMNGFILPHDIVEKARVEQAKALGLLLNNNDKCMLMRKVSERREKIMAENQAMENVIVSANPIAMEGITWEHHVPPSGDITTRSLDPNSFASLEEKERDLSELIVSGTRSTLGIDQALSGRGEEAGDSVKNGTIWSKKSDLLGTIPADGLTVNESESEESLYDDGVQDKVGGIKSDKKYQGGNVDCGEPRKEQEDEGEVDVDSNPDKMGHVGHVSSEEHPAAEEKDNLAVTESNSSGQMITNVPSN